MKPDQHSQLVIETAYGALRVFICLD